LFDGHWRTGVDRVTAPIGASLRHSGLSADHFTAAGLVLASATAVAVGSGRLGLGLVLLVLTALPDMLDGAVAKATGTASPRGAFFDSVADRVSDSLVLGGFGWYLAGEDGGRAAMLPFAVLALSTLISYQRAKAESLGYSAKGGLMERAERIIALGVGLAFPVLLVPVLWLMVVLTAVTAVPRFAKVWRQASVPPRPPPSVAPAQARRLLGERPWAASVAVADWRRRRREAGAGAAAWRSRRSRRAGTRP
jgi:CDP-diacylglycerol--glycerol-3-phosphate 3-phosphatidyltransferase